MRQIVLRHALSGKPTAADFEAITAPTPACPDGGVLARVVHLSLDPYVGARLRGRHMGEPAPEPGRGVIPGAIVGQVVESRSADAPVGAWVASMEGGWRELAPLKPGSWRTLDPHLAPLAAHAGVLGMPGLTAWAGMTQLAKVGAGDVVLVDAAAGPVGGTAGQIARARGAARVIGIAGGREKCALVTGRYGFDACLDYQAEGWEAELAEIAGEDVSVHFENVSIGMLTKAMARLRPYGRVILCGLADHYHGDGPPAGVPAGLVIGKRAALFGLVVYDFYARWGEFLDEIAPLVARGQIAFAEDRVQGLDQAPALMERLVAGANVGKAVVSVSPERL